MYHQKKILLGVLTTLLYTTSPNLLAYECSHYHCDPLFLILGTGISFSQKAHIFADPVFWDPANEGYHTKLHNTELYTAGFGYRFTDLIDGSLEVNHRPSYKYSKFQTMVSGSSTPAPGGDKTRKFKLSNTNVMANIICNGCGIDLVANLGEIYIQPFVGAGLGVAYNTISDFHSVRTVSQGGFNNVAAIMNDNIKKSLAWQLMLGTELALTQKFALDLGYRYMNSGHFKSNNYITSVPSGFTQATAAPPWKGKLKAQEIFLNLKYYF